MKRLFSIFLSIVLVVAAVVGAWPALQAHAAAPNLVSNPSAETSASGVMPDSWQTGNWGANTPSFTYATNGHSGLRSLKVAITSYTDGDAKWYFDPVAVTSGQTYNFSDYYIANVPTDIVVQFGNGSSFAYQWLASVPAAAGWTQTVHSFTVPAGYSTATVFHLINGVGSLQTDDYSLASAAASDLAVAVTAPAANSVVSGASVALSANASSTGGIAGVQFKVDGANIGGEDTTAPYGTTWNSTTASNGVHSITATARGTDGATLTSAAVSVTVSNAIPEGTNLVPNPSVETTVTGNPALPANWQTSSWGTNTPTFTYTGSANAHTGSHGIKVQMSSYTDGDAKWYFDPQPVDSSKLYTFRDYYKGTTRSYAVASFAMNDGSYRYTTLGTLAPSSTWQKFEQQFSVPDGAATVTVFHLIHSVGQVITDDYSLTSYTPVGFNRPLISLTFDDAWASVYTNALPILQKYGVHSTQYLLTGKTADPEYMTVAMMQAMKNAGEEIGSHGVDHSDLTTLTATQQNQQLRQSKNYLQQWTGATVTNFASPYGAADQNTITRIQNYYASHRGVVPGYNSKNYFNPYDIKVQNITSSTTPAQIQAWVAKAQATNTWLVLVYHQVDDAPGSEDEYNTTPAQLDAHLSVIKNSGVAVVTVGQALAELKPQL